MAVDEKTEDETLDWNVDTEVQLFHAMRGHKPVGVNRYFQMACIHEKFSNSLNREVSSQRIWDRLETMYDMAALHESEILPFPNDELEFTLPHGDFGKLLAERNGGENVPIPTSVKVKSEPKRQDPPEGRSKSGKEIYSGGKTKHDNYSSSNSTTSISSNVSSKQSKVETPAPVKNIKSEEKAKDILETSKVKVENKKEKENVASVSTKPSGTPPVKIEAQKSSKNESKSGKESSSKSYKTEEKGSKNRAENISTPKTTRSDSTSSSSSKTSKAEASTPTNSSSSSSSKTVKTDSTQKKKDDTKGTKESKSSKTDPDDIPLSKISVSKSKKHEVKEGNSAKRKRPMRTPESSSSSSSRGNTPTTKRRRT